MPSTKTMAQMEESARQLADQQGATGRFPQTEVFSYLNRGIAEFWDILIATKGWPYVGLTYFVFGTVSATGTTPPTVTVSGNPNDSYTLLIEILVGGTLGVATFQWSINSGATWISGTTAASVTLGNTGITASFAAGTYNADNAYQAVATPLPLVSGQSTYDLPVDFYRLHSVLMQSSIGNDFYEIFEMGATEESSYINPNTLTGYPVVYRLQGARTGRCSISVYPPPSQGSFLRINYFPYALELTDPAATFDGINGWEIYPITYAALQMSIKDEDLETQQRLSSMLDDVKRRIQGLAWSRQVQAQQIQKSNRKMSRWGKYRLPRA